MLEGRRLYFGGPIFTTKNKWISFLKGHYHLRGHLLLAHPLKTKKIKAREGLMHANQNA